MTDATDERTGPRRGLLVTVYALFFIAFWLTSTLVFTAWVNEVGGFVWGWGILALPIVVPGYALAQRFAFRRKPSWRRRGWAFLGVACLATALLYPGLAAGIATLGAAVL